MIHFALLFAVRLSASNRACCHSRVAFNLQPSDQLRFAIQVDASSLSTGHYSYDLVLVAHFGSETSTKSYSGYYDVVNRNGSEIGEHWTVAGWSHLVADSGGMLFVNSNGSAAWFVDNGDDTFTSPAGHLFASSLIRNMDSTFTLTLTSGVQAEFDTDGNLTSLVDTNGNSTDYTYVDADSDTKIDELSQVTGPFGRTITFNYTSGLLSSVQDYAGRTTNVSHDGSDRLDSITAPDPDDAGPLTAPVTSFVYNTDDLMTGITDALSQTTTLEYGFGGRLEKAIYADTSEREFTSIQTRGLVDVDAGEGTTSNPGTLYRLNELPGTSDSYDGSRETDRFGNVTKFTDALDNITTIQRDWNGLVVQQTTPDPDGGGPQTALVTKFEYDGDGNTTKITLPDNSTLTSVYNTDNRPTSVSDELGRTTTLTYDSNSNLLTQSDPLGNTTSYAYDSNGLVTSVTSPDPDGAGPLVAPVTSFSYDTSGRLTQVTNARQYHSAVGLRCRRQRDEYNQRADPSHDIDVRQPGTTAHNHATRSGRCWSRPSSRHHLSV